MVLEQIGVRVHGHGQGQALGRRRAGAAGAPLPKRRLTFPPTRAEYTF